MKDLVFKPAAELAGLIKDRQISSLELLEAYIDRYEQYNPQLNAIVITDFDQARKKARAADLALEKAENWGPLHGLPMTIKDNIEAVGMRCTGGSKFLENHQPDRDAALVRSLRCGSLLPCSCRSVPLVSWGMNAPMNT